MCTIQSNHTHTHVIQAVELNMEQELCGYYDYYNTTIRIDCDLKKPNIIIYITSESRVPLVRNRTE